MIKMLLTILIFLSVGFSSKTFAQDTIRYISRLDNFLMYESIELYPDSTFKWTSEYDLVWSESGKYQLSEHHLTLNFSESVGNKIKTYVIETNKMYLMDITGRKINKIKDKSIKTNGSWFRCGKHNYGFTLLL